MTMISKTKDMLEGLVREGSMKWVLGRRSSFEDEFEDMSRSPSGQRKWMSELSPAANVIVGRCSRFVAVLAVMGNEPVGLPERDILSIPPIIVLIILNVSMDELRINFDSEASELIKHPSRTLALSVQVIGHLSDKNFRHLTFDMMVAWEAPGAASEPVLKIDSETTVGGEAFSRIAPAVPSIADVVTSADLFDALTSSTGGRLLFSVYEKYLAGLERAIKKMMTQSESSVLSTIRLPRGERILDVDGTVTTQPVLQHLGMSTWPGRLSLTDHALYFEPLRVVSFDKAKIYDLADDLRQVVKAELTGPWGTRLFDKAVLYKSISLSEPVVMEFPELSGHSRRDYWLTIIREILFAHKFIRKFQIEGVEREEILSKAVLGILRLQAIQEMILPMPVRWETLLMFNLADQLPGGDRILETLASILASREFDRTNNPTAASGMNSISALAMLSNLGISLGSGSHIDDGKRLLVGEIVVGEMSSLERAVKDSRNNFKKVEQAQATVDGVKVEGIDTNLAVMKELLSPVLEIGKYLQFLASWDEPLKSLAFCLLTSYIIYRPVDEVKVVAPPPMNTMEQLLAVQNAISQFEELVQDGNVTLLKMRALLLAVFPQATERLALVLVLTALVLAFVPAKFIVLMVFLETFTWYSPPRKSTTERWMRRLKEWWFSIPAAPVVLERTSKEYKKDKKTR
ncbi:hypothetical protein ACLOJK_032988 [Asimina triloba]